MIQLSFIYFFKKQAFQKRSVKKTSIQKWQVFKKTSVKRITLQKREALEEISVQKNECPKTTNVKRISVQKRQALEGTSVQKNKCPKIISVQKQGKIRRFRRIRYELWQTDWYLKSVFLTVFISKFFYGIYVITTFDGGDGSTCYALLCAN